MRLEIAFAGVFKYHGHMSEKTIILIDGSNFYFKLKDLKLHNLINFNFKDFCTYLARDKEILYCCYYVGRIKQDGTEKTDKLFNAQQKLIGHLKNHSVKYYLGYLINNDGIYHEKGVDVKIAADILVAAYENQCHRIIVASSDTDLEPAIKKAKEKGKVIEYVGFSHKASIAMVRFATESTLLKKEDLEKFISPKLT